MVGCLERQLPTRNKMGATFVILYFLGATLKKKKKQVKLILIISLAQAIHNIIISTYNQHKIIKIFYIIFPTMCLKCSAYFKLLTHLDLD